MGKHRHVPSLSERFRIIKRPGIRSGLIVTLMWAISAYSVFTYISPLVAGTTSIPAAWVSGQILIWGICAVLGMYLGGRGTDHLGPVNVLFPSLMVLTSAFATLALCSLLPQGVARYPFMVAFVLWGISAWSYFPPQQTRLIEAAGEGNAPLIMSLNASVMYLGFSGGAGLGGLLLSQFNAWTIPTLAAGTAGIATLVVWITRRHGTPASE
ncbi:hypothetical protein HA45_22195 [Pantoea rodasii]|nr:hypothetical protein HA45_22195 [Pantoea rodasii]